MERKRIDWTKDFDLINAAVWDVIKFADKTVEGDDLRRVEKAAGRVMQKTVDVIRTRGGNVESLTDEMDNLAIACKVCGLNAEIVEKSVKGLLTKYESSNPE